MNNEWTRLYNRAMNFCNDGCINKALEICEKIIADDLSCSEALNLKGLMLYQKGLLKEARIVWKLNCDINNDSMAEKYIEDSKSDDERAKMYKEAESNLKNLNIDRALMLFRQCAQSDFNSIKVNTGIAMCYLRKGDNYRAKEYVDKALSIDNEAVTANAIKKDLIKSRLYSKNKSASKRILSVITILFILGAVCAGGYSIYRKVKADNQPAEYAENNVAEDKEADKNENVSDSENSNEDVEDMSNEDNKNSQSNLEEKQATTIFDRKQVTVSLKDKDVDKLYDEIEGVDKNSLSEEDLEVYNKASELLKTDGAAKFYEYGVWYFNNGDYDSAKCELEKAYKYCKDSYLKEHIVFYKGSTASQMGDNSEALKLYKEYYSMYPKGAYIEGVLYELALLTNTTNKDMGKQYAQELVERYPNSVYINDYIKQIIE